MSNPSSDETIQLHRPPFLSPLTVGGLGTVASLWLFLIGIGPLAWRDSTAGWVLAASIALLITTLVARTWLRPHSGPRISCSPTHLTLPRHAGSKRMIAVPIVDVLGVSVFGKGGFSIMIISTRDRLFAYRCNRFVDAHPEALLRHTLVQRLSTLPDGEARCLAMGERESLAQRLSLIVPYLTYALFLSVALVFGAQVLGGALGKPLSLVAFGGNAPELVARGQWFRLFTANFIHGGIMHVYVNGVSLLVMGPLLERMLGRIRFVVVVLASALGGAIASAAVARSPVSVGFSTALFGMLGSLAYLNIRFRTDLPAGTYIPRRAWLITVVANGALSFVPGIDAAAHVGGLLSGVAATALVSRRFDRAQGMRQPGVPTHVLAFTMTSLCVLAIATQAQRSSAQIHADEALVLSHVLDSGDLPVEQLNDWAWERSTDVHAGTDELRVAVAAAERGADMVGGKSGQNSHVVGTLAVAYAALDRREPTIAKAKSPAAPATSPDFHRLARLLAAKLHRQDGLQRVGLGKLAVTSAKIETVAGERQWAVGMNQTIDLPAGTKVYVLIKGRTERDSGLLEVQTVTPRSPAQYTMRGPESYARDLGLSLDLASLTFEVALIEPLAAGQAVPKAPIATYTRLLRKGDSGAPSP